MTRTRRVAKFSLAFAAAAAALWITFAAYLGPEAIIGLANRVFFC